MDLPIRLNHDRKLDQAGRRHRFVGPMSEAGPRVELSHGDRHLTRVSRDEGVEPVVEGLGVGGTGGKQIYETDGWYDIIIVGSEVGNEDTIMGRLVGKCVSIVGIYETDGWYDSIIVGLENDIEGSMIGRLVGKCKGDIEGTVGTYETDGRYDCTLVGSEDGDEDTIIGRLVG